MLEAIIKFALARRGLVMVLVLMVMGLGVWKFTQLPIDAVPDITRILPMFRWSSIRQRRVIPHWKQNNA